MELAQLLHATKADASSQSSRVPSGWRVEAVPAWNDDAVYYQLKQVENQTLPDHPNAIDRILDATLGFGGEISKLLRASLNFEGIEQARHEIVARIAPSRHTLYEAIGWPSSLSAADTRRVEEMLELLDGEKRAEMPAASAATAYGVPGVLLTFVRWMELLQEGRDGTWRVPAIYKALLQSARQSPPSPEGA